MSTLRTGAIWAGVLLISLVSAACWFAAVVTIMIWPIPTIAILTVSSVTSLAAMHLVNVRVAAEERREKMRAAVNYRPAPRATASSAQDRDEQLREVLGADVYDELSALDPASGPRRD